MRESSSIACSTVPNLVKGDLEWSSLSDRGAVVLTLNSANDKDHQSWADIFIPPDVFLGPK